MQILKYVECNPIVKRRCKYWSYLTYCRSWPYLRFWSAHKNPYFYVYIFILVASAFYFTNFSFLTCLILSYIYLHIHLYISAVAISTSLFLKSHPELFREDFEEYFGKSHNELFVCADDKNNLLGCVAMTKENEQSPVIELRRMRVASKARGSGLAQKLCEKAEEFARSRGEKIIELTTTSDQLAAIAVYKRNGFKVERVSRGQFNVGLLPGFPFCYVNMIKHLY